MNFYPYNHKSFIEKAFYKVSGRFVSFQLPYVRERFFHFDDEILKISGDLYLDGYWQSEKYFTEISDLLKKELILNITGTSEEEAVINKFCAINKHINRIKTNKEKISYSGFACNNRRL